MPLLVRGGGGGKNTKDATAVPGDVRSGKTFYGANGKQTGTLDIKEEKIIIFDIKDSEDIAPIKRNNSVIYYGDYYYFSPVTIWDKNINNNSTGEMQYVSLAEDCISYIVDVYGGSHYNYKADIYKSITLPEDVTDVWIECVGEYGTKNQYIETGKVHSVIRFNKNDFVRFKNNKKWHLLAQIKFIKQSDNSSYTHDEIYLSPVNEYNDSFSNGVTCILFGWSGNKLSIGIGFSVYEIYDLPSPYDETAKYYFDMNMKFIIHYTTK